MADVEAPQQPFDKLTAPSRIEGEKRLTPRRGALDRYRLFIKLAQGWGKLRRFYLSKFRRGYVTQARSHRRGECRRCGACCAIMFRCPYLKDGNHCSIYEKRHEQCGHFPIDVRDLRFLDHVCGHYFVEKDE